MQTASVWKLLTSLTHDDECLKRLCYMFSTTIELTIIHDGLDGQIFKKDAFFEMQTYRVGID